MAAYFASNGLFGLHVVEQDRTYLFGLYQNSSNGRKMEIRAKIN